MAKPKHLEILKQGVEAWNEWRKKHPKVTPGLFEASLIGENLRRADFRLADLRFADLREADLSEANFIGALLSEASLSWARLSKADLREADLGGARLSGALLIGANLIGANLIGANLRQAELREADLRRADLRRADLGWADLSEADLHRAHIREADLRGAHLRRADLSGADLGGADLTGAIANSTVFANIDLSSVKGLEAVKHAGPSTIDVDTLNNSAWRIPESFLRGCGVPESFIVQMRALAASTEATQFYSCFISYSSKDQDLANRLYADLQSRGVRCWFAPEDMKIGDRFRSRIDESIRVYDKLLLVLSENSVASSWVEKEVETAMERETEDRQRRTILFPVRLDDAVMKVKTGWPADVRRTRHIGDFTDWKNRDSYQKAFDRLLHDLRAEGKKA